MQSSESLPDRPTLQGPPEHPSVIIQGRDLHAPDPLIAKLRVRGLPDLADMPADWELFVLHLLTAELGLPTTLPELWEQQAGRQERLLVIWPGRLVDYPPNPELGYCCDAMPRQTADAFRLWLVAQVFSRRRRNAYGEPLLVSYLPTEPPSVVNGVPIRWPVRVAGLSSNRLHIIPALHPGATFAIPLEFLAYPALPEVVQRARAALADPGQVVAPLDRPEQPTQLLKGQPLL